jgi:hypothetical protein
MAWGILLWAFGAQSGVAAKCRWQVTCSILRRGSLKLSVIALDYDGTVARGDVLDPAVREAIALARTRGIVVLLVTGRILDELRRVAGDLHFVDAVIAENGAVTFPTAGGLRLWHPWCPKGLSPNCDVAGFRFLQDGAWSTRMRTRRRGCWRSFARWKCHSSSSSTVDA